MSDATPPKWEEPVNVPSGSSGLPASNDERQWAMLAHLSGLAGYVIPLANVIAPLIIWIVKKEEMPFVEDQAKEALNFQISMLIYITVSALAICFVVGIVTTPILAVVQIVYSIIGALKANQGEYYRYPLTIRLVN